MYWLMVSEMQCPLNADRLRSRYAFMAEVDVNIYSYFG